MAEQATSPVERLVELFVYAPVGMALAARDDLPRLVDKGRQTVGSQIVLARMVGRIAVRAGTRQAGKLIDHAATVVANGWAGSPPQPNGSSERAAPADDAASSRPRPPRPPADDAPSADDLAIPGYDSLAAPQVVSRLAGLSSGERDAVRRYEESHRGRRTILSKIAQLDAEPD